MNRIKLQNGKTVLATMVNYEYEVGETRKGYGSVIAEDQKVNDLMRYVVWTVFPDGSDNWAELPWIAENGAYMLTWNEAINEMHRRFVAYGIAMNQADFRNTHNVVQYRRENEPF